MRDRFPHLVSSKSIFPCVTRWSLFVSLFWVGCAFIFSSCTQTQHLPQAQQGIFSLAGWNSKQEGVLKLTGEWEFYWNQLLTPEDFQATLPPARTGFINLPDKWNDYQVDNQGLPGMGYATFRLVINQHRVSESYGLKILDMGTAYRIWVNGQPLMSNGVVGKNRQLMTPQYLGKIAFFKASSKPIEIILQVSNFNHRKGGVWKAIEFGLEKKIRDKREWQLAIQLFLFGSLFIMGLYHLGLYINRPKDKSLRWSSRQHLGGKESRSGLCIPCQHS